VSHLEPNVEMHRARAIWCFFKAWSYYLKDDQEMTDALLRDMAEHLLQMFFNDQKRKRGAYA
jgi:hypothetical protein